MKVQRWVPAAQAALLLAGSAAAPSAVAAGRSEQASSKDRSGAECGVAPLAPGVIEAAVTRPEGHASYQDWLASEEVQARLEELHSLVDSLGPQVVGLAIDHNEQRMVIVVDPSLTSVALDEVEAKAASLAVPFVIGVEKGCNTRASLDGVVEELRADRGSRYWGLRYSFGLDAGSGKVVVTTPDQGIAADVEKRFGSLVHVVLAEVPSYVGGRDNDSSAHYGDANVGCSTNFAMVSGFGVAASMTAAHCGSNGTVFKSGANLYGTGQNRNGASADYMMIYDSGQTYSRTFYTDPGSPSTRTVIGKSSGGVGSIVCAGGAVSKSDCGAEVWMVASFPGADSGSVSVMAARRSASQEYICQTGDSGGVVYQRSGSTGALATGLITGGINDASTSLPANVFGYYVCYFQTISQIESQSGFTLWV